MNQPILCRLISPSLALILFAACSDDVAPAERELSTTGLDPGDNSDGDEYGAAADDSPEPPASTMGESCAPPVPEPTSVEVSYFDGERVDGVRYWGGTAAYVLTSGDIGEAHVLVDSDGFGEAYFAINGDIVGHASISDDEDEADEPIVVSWMPTDVSYSAELISELLQEEVAAIMINGMVPQKFKCSRFGRKVLKAAKYLWLGASAAVGATCCMATKVGCPLCAGGARALGAAGADAADNYCE